MAFRRGFSRQPQPPRCNLFSPTFSVIFLPPFSFPHLFTLRLPCFYASNLSSSPAPHQHPSLFTSIAIFRNPIPARVWKVKGVSPSSSSHLPHRLLQTSLFRLSSLNRASSHVRGTCRHPNATFDHCFYWEPSSSCCALGCQGEAGGERETEKSKVMSS